jgi:type I restriction enzyme M protein
LFYGTGLAACVLIMRRSKPEATKGKVLFVNAEKLFRRGRNQNSLAPDHADQILKAHQAFADADGLAHVADLAEIEANGFNLNIPLYVAPADDGEKLTVAQALADLEAAQQNAIRTRAALEAELAKWGLSA